jgi:hypothetical protein
VSTPVFSFGAVVAEQWVSDSMKTMEYAMTTMTRNNVQRGAARPRNTVQRFPERGIPIAWQVAAVRVSALGAACAIRYSPNAKFGELTLIRITAFKKWVRDMKTLPAQLLRLKAARLIEYRVASGGYEVKPSKPVGAFLVGL